MNMKINWDKVEKTIGGLKFAVVMIVLFTVCMIVGTFLESYYGTDFANRLIYKSFFFMFIQFCIFLSIIFAAFLRLPPKKRLYGFYVIHTGLVIIGVGAFITYIAGIDGHMTLAPNETTREVILSRDIFKITYPNEGKQVSAYLPYTAFETDLNQSYKEITLKKFLPFAEGRLAWLDSANRYRPTDPIQSSQYHFKNSFAEQDITLSLHPEASNDFQSTLAIGPLTIVYLPEKIAECFKRVHATKILFWNTNSGDCFTPEEKQIPLKKTSANHRFYVVPFEKKLFMFFPELSPFPMDTKLKSDENSVLRILALELFEKKPMLFLFGKHASFYSKDDQKWHTEDFSSTSNSITLPWMNAQINLVNHETSNKFPSNIPTPTVPIQKDGNLIKGDLKAVQIKISGKHYWISNEAPLGLIVDGKKVTFEVTKESITLPFELALTEFKMEKDPGTNMPASYESYVKLFDGNTTNNHHIYMNNPLKFMGYTFYQASYAQDERGTYNSTLSVNVDQGRPLKYLGSLMLVLGAIWHYSLNNRKKGTSS